MYFTVSKSWSTTLSIDTVLPLYRTLSDIDRRSTQGRGPAGIPLRLSALHWFITDRNSQWICTWSIYYGEPFQGWAWIGNFYWLFSFESQILIIYRLFLIPLGFSGFKTNPRSRIISENYQQIVISFRVPARHSRERPLCCSPSDIDRSESIGQSTALEWNIGRWVSKFSVSIVVIFARVSLTPRFCNTHIVSIHLEALRCPHKNRWSLHHQGWLPSRIRLFIPKVHANTNAPQLKLLKKDPSGNFD